MKEFEFAVTKVIGLPETQDISLVCIDLVGKNHCVVNNNSDTVYICIEGQVFFYVYDIDKVFKPTILNPGESIRIPCGTPYFDVSENGVRMISINKPAYDESFVIELPHPLD